MSQAATEDPRQKLIRLVGEGVSVRAAAHACRLPRNVASGILSSATIASGPFSGAPQSPIAVPTPNATADQPAPPPANLVRTPIHGHTFQSFSAPLAFDGFTLARVRSAISQHRQGIFLESSLLARAILSFGPVLAALKQRMSPMMSLPRHIRCGTRGLSRVLGQEVEAQLAPRSGLSPSPYFPHTLWGAIQYYLAMDGFAVLQHVHGEPDLETGVAPVYTRLWPNWAVQYYRYRKTYVAITSEGPVDIISGDGKFTLIADNDEPHFLGAIVALGEEALAGKFSQQSRSDWIQRYGNPKLVGEMPPGVGVRTPEGDAFFDALSTLRGPDGFGLIPNGASLTWEQLQASQSTAFKDDLDSHWQFVAAILLGSDGTMTRGTGVYSAPIFAGVRRDLVDQDLKAAVRGINLGHVRPWLQFNYAESIAAAKGWEEPVLDIPLPDPDADARIKSYSDRVLAFHAIVKAEREAGFVVTQERASQLAESLSIDCPTLRDPTGKEFPSVSSESTSNSDDSESKAQQGSAESSSEATRNGGTTTGDE